MDRIIQTIAIYYDSTRSEAMSKTLSKFSKHYRDTWYEYWWDFSPGRIESLKNFDSVTFIQRDTKKCCHVSAVKIRQILHSTKQTSRGYGNWGIRVLSGRYGALAFEEPGRNKADWRLLPVEWKIA